jgi:hypothetical protein
MSALATGKEAHWLPAPSWLRCAGAVIWGSLLAWVAAFVWLLPHAGSQVAVALAACGGTPGPRRPVHLSR